jgi:hypothetical protein
MAVIHNETSWIWISIRLQSHCVKAKLRSIADIQPLGRRLGKS